MVTAGFGLAKVSTWVEPVLNDFFGAGRAELKVRSASETAFSMLPREEEEGLEGGDGVAVAGKQWLK